MTVFVWEFFSQFTIFRHRIFPDKHTERESQLNSRFMWGNFIANCLRLDCRPKCIQRDILWHFFFPFSPSMAGVELKLLATKNFHSILKPALLHFNSNSDQICCIEIYMVPKRLLCIFFLLYVKIVRLKTMKKLAKTKVLLRFEYLFVLELGLCVRK